MPRTSRKSKSTAESGVTLPSTPPAKRRDWCVTWNNPTPEDVDHVRQIITDECTYGIYGCERGKQGTPHLQIYVHFKNQRSFNSVRTMFKENHIEPRKGTHKQASDYCVKEPVDLDFPTDRTWSKGDLPSPGSRTDIDTVRDSFRNRQPLYTISQEVGYQALRYGELLWKHNGSKRACKPIVAWYYGPSNSGKTYEAELSCPETPYVHPGGLLKWWDTYYSEDYIILDDLRPEQTTLAYLLRLFDRLPMRVETKGGYTPMLAKQIIVTSDRSPHRFFAQVSDNGRDRVGDICQLIRRIDFIVRFEKDRTQHHEKVGEGDMSVPQNCNPYYPQDGWDYFNLTMTQVGVASSSSNAPPYVPPTTCKEEEE